MLLLADVNILGDFHDDDCEADDSEGPYILDAIKEGSALFLDGEFVFIDCQVISDKVPRV